MKYPIIPITNEQKLAVDKFNADEKIKFEEINCTNCKSIDFKILFKNDRYGFNQQTVLCNNCGLTYSNPRMTEDSAKYFYFSDLYRKIYLEKSDIEAYFFKKNYSQKIEINRNIKVNKPNYNKHYPQLFFDFICSLNLDYNTVCEIGAGSGSNLIYFKNLGKNVFGIEPSEKLTKLAIDNQIDIKQGFIDDVKDKYDMIVLKHVFEHLSNPIKNLKKLHSHINKYLFIEVPGIIERISSIQNAHNFYFTENTLHKIITKTGFKIVSSRYCNETEFIYALYEKSYEKNIDFNYSYLNEVKKIKKIYKNDIIRMNITKIIRNTGLYNLLLPIRKIVLKILNLR